MIQQPYSAVSLTRSDLMIRSPINHMKSADRIRWESFNLPGDHWKRIEKVLYLRREMNLNDVVNVWH